MKTFCKSKVLRDNSIKLRELSGNNSPLTASKNTSKSNYAVVVFNHHRDVKVALDDLENVGLTCDGISLIARKAHRHAWHPELEINNYFESVEFNFNQIAQEFICRLFQRGKYLVFITGNQDDVNFTSKIMGRRPGHSEVWYFQSV